VHVVSGNAMGGA